VNKTDLIEAIAKSADISKAAAGRALEGALAAIRTSLRKGQPVSLVGFAAPSTWAGAPRARAGTPAPARPSRSRLPRCPSSGLEKRSGMH